MNAETPAPKSPRRFSYVRSSFPAWADGIVAALIAVLIGLTAIHVWPLSDIGIPWCSGGDCSSAQYIIKTVMERGWYTSNPDMGAPFGATMYDYPIPEPTSLLYIRLLGLFTGNPFLVFNLFYLTSFVTAALAACWGLKRCGTARPLAIAGAVAFALLPYHFLRLPHLFLASYFSAAVFACFALRLALPGGPAGILRPRIGWGTLILLALAAGAGVYYAFFACIFIASGAVLGAIRQRNAAVLRTGAIYLGVIVGVIAISLIPNLIFHLTHGINPLVAHRAPADAEIYGLRITQLLLPTPGHRIPWMRAITDNYAKTAPLVDENATAALGIMGSIGFLIAMAVFLFGVARHHPRIAAAGALIVIGVLYATIGGFGAIAARIAIPDIRGLNRLSVFIGFLSLFGLLAVIQNALRRHANIVVQSLVALVIIAVAWVDQVPAHGLAIASHSDFKNKQAEFAQLADSLPPGTSVFELPYVFYPEAPPAIRSYVMLEPYLFTRGFRWSFGGMHGRASDIWNKDVSTLQGVALASALRSASFGAVYVDRTAVEGHDAAIEKDLSQDFGSPVLENRDMAVYRIQPSAAPLFPHVAIGAGDGWWFNEKPATILTAWSKGDADLQVVNPGDKPQTVSVRFQLYTLTPRNVRVVYQGKEIISYALERGKRTNFQMSLVAPPGDSRIMLITDKPAQLPGNGDPREMAMYIEKLSLGPLTDANH